MAGPATVWRITREVRGGPGVAQRTRTALDLLGGWPCSLHAQASLKGSETLAEAGTAAAAAAAAAARARPGMTTAECLEGRGGAASAWSNGLAIRWGTTGISRGAGGGGMRTPSTLLRNPLPWGGRWRVDNHIRDPWKGAHRRGWGRRRSIWHVQRRGRRERGGPHELRVLVKTSRLVEAQARTPSEIQDTLMSQPSSLVACPTEAHTVGSEGGGAEGAGGSS
ncbi:hypothetical protein T484DRAFT_2650996 [Baffinella frigidus]|nr:hypothetical protein T484DRAFT_2650996 [Cryptophyta sp. CCMP2293]